MIVSSSSEPLGSRIIPLPSLIDCDVTAFGLINKPFSLINPIKIALRVGDIFQGNKSILLGLGVTNSAAPPD